VGNVFLKISANGAQLLKSAYLGGPYATRPARHQAG